MKNGNSCPSTEELIEYVGRRGEGRQMEEHLRGCEECAAELSILSILTGVGSKEREISEAMISRILADLPAPEAVRQPSPVTRLQILIGWGLGFLTGLLSGAAADSFSDIGPGKVVLLAAVFGLLCVFFGQGQRGSATEAGPGLAGADFRD